MSYGFVMVDTEVGCALHRENTEKQVLESYLPPDALRQPSQGTRGFWAIVRPPESSACNHLFSISFRLESLSPGSFPPEGQTKQTPSAAHGLLIPWSVTEPQT